MLVGGESVQQSRPSVGVQIHAPELHVAGQRVAHTLEVTAGLGAQLWPHHRIMEEPRQNPRRAAETPLPRGRVDHRHDPALLLHEQFAEQARRTPDGIALHAKEGSVTFADLAAKVDRVARAFRAGGIVNGFTGGVHMERSIDYVPSVLAVLKSNSAEVPLPPSYPEGRLRDILSFSRLDAVIDTMRRRSILAYRSHPPSLRAVSRRRWRRQRRAASPDQPAFVLCSSGSTGTPKMIVRSHRSFFHRLNWTWDNHPYSSGEGCCQKSYMSTTHAIYELFEPLLRGVPVRIITDDEVRDLERFAHYLHPEDIRILLIGRRCSRPRWRWFAPRRRSRWSSHGEST